MAMLSKANKSGHTGVRKRPDCSINDHEAYLHVYGLKLSMHSPTKRQAIRDRQVMSMVIQRLKAADLLKKPI